MFSKYFDRYTLFILNSCHNLGDDNYEIPDSPGAGNRRSRHPPTDPNAVPPTDPNGAAPPAGGSGQPPAGQSGVPPKGPSATSTPHPKRVAVNLVTGKFKFNLN